MISKQQFIPNLSILDWIAMRVSNEHAHIYTGDLISIYGAAFGNRVNKMSAIKAIYTTTEQEETHKTLWDS